MKADFEKGTKVCSKCKRELPITEFYKNKSQIDGLTNYCNGCIKRYRKTKKGKEFSKRSNDKIINVFGRTGRKRGQSGMLKRDYELTEEQLQRRNKNREFQRKNKANNNPHGVLVWYSGLLDELPKEEYKRMFAKEYTIQKICAIRGYIERVEPSEHFLFDFDLEQMLKDNVYYGNNVSVKYIHKWWKGEIKHWTVNDGVWKDGK